MGRLCPVPGSGRLETLDALRGIVIPGGLLKSVNALTMTMPACSRSRIMGDTDAPNPATRIVAHMVSSMIS
jgi:uncharacterized membrane protein YeiB